MSAPGLNRNVQNDTFSLERPIPYERGKTCSSCLPMYQFCMAMAEKLLQMQTQVLMLWHFLKYMVGPKQNVV